MQVLYKCIYNKIRLNNVTTLNANFRYNILHKSRLLQVQRGNAKEKQRYIKNRNKLFTFMFLHENTHLEDFVCIRAEFHLKFLMSYIRNGKSRNLDLLFDRWLVTLSYLASRLHFIHNYPSCQKKISLYCKAKERRWWSGRHVRVSCWNR